MGVGFDSSRPDNFMIKIDKDKNGIRGVAYQGLGGHLLYWAIQIAVAFPLAYLFCKYVLNADLFA